MPRARDLGIEIGSLPTGPTNSVLDVHGVGLGHRRDRLGEHGRDGEVDGQVHPGSMSPRPARRARSARRVTTLEPAAIP